jgi:enoyl-CoA hydratase/carnithine racemase
MTLPQTDVEPATDKIIARKERGIGWLIFNQPERRNAMSIEMWEAIPDVLADFASDPAVRVVVMAGAGDKAFVSGADISQFEQSRSDAESAEHYARTTAAAWTALGGLEKPLIAMIRGFCIGGGLAIALKADVRIAADDAQFAIPAARLGLAYAADGIGELVALIGPSEAKSILFSAERLDAQRALRIGLINRVVPVAGLEQAVRDYAQRLSENAPLTIRSAKITIDELMRNEGERDMTRVEASYQACFASEDYKEGRRAFMEKRKPRFTGR